MEDDEFLLRDRRSSTARHANVQTRKSMVFAASPILTFLFGLFVGHFILTRAYKITVLKPIVMDGRELGSYLNSSAGLPDALAEDLRLNYHQCDIAFPLLWEQLHRTRDHHMNRGVREKDLYDGQVAEETTRVAIINNQLYIKRFKPEYTTRSQAILASLNEAITTSPEPIPNVEFVFRGTDSIETEGPIFGLNREVSDETQWLLPDFGFWSWPEPKVLSWRETIRKAKEVDSKIAWGAKAKKLFWRGAFLAEIRSNLRDYAARYPAWNDIGAIEWGDGAKGLVTLEDHCKHRFLAATEGNSAYSGRLKYTLLCRSVNLSHRMRWTQHFHPALNAKTNDPGQNFIEVQGGASSPWDGLAETMDELIRDQAKAQRIAANSVRTMRDRYLTPASVSCYWRRLLREYSKVMRFQATRDGGVDYQSFSLMGGQVDWAPH